MASIEPLTGATIYDNSDAALGGQQSGDVVTDLAPFTIPYFATNAVRDTKFAAWVAAGNTMRNGLHCNVAGHDQVYRDGKWRPVGPAIVMSVRNVGGHPLAANDWTTIPFGNEDVDTANAHATGSERFVAPQDGIYVASAQVSFTFSTASPLSYRGLRIRKNGLTGQLPGATTLLPVAANGYAVIATAAVPVQLNGGDWLDVQAYHNAADAITTYSDADRQTALHVWALPGL